jgi:hypothetical protein
MSDWIAVEASKVKRGDVVDTSDGPVVLTHVGPSIFENSIHLEWAGGEGDVLRSDKLAVQAKEG